MNIADTFNEIVTLSIEERMNLVQDIWNSIAAEQAGVMPTERQHQELDYRVADYEANPDNVMTWDEVKASIKKQHC